MEEIRNIIIFDQYIGKKPWKNEAGEKFNVVSYLDLADMNLKRLFIPPTDFIGLGLKGLFTRQQDEINVLKAKIEIDEDEHENLKIIEVKEIYKLDKKA